VPGANEKLVKSSRGDFEDAMSTHATGTRQ
jgi:hypothetical protein